MKNFLASVLASCCLLSIGYSQTKFPIRPAALGISFTLTDFETAQRIRSTSLASVANKNAAAKLREMAPGIAINYFQGLTPKIDFAATLNGTFVDYPFRGDHPPFGNNYFLTEGDVSGQFKLLPENYWVIPYASAGLGVHTYQGYFGSFIPLGVGLRLNLFDEAGINLNSQYRVPVSYETSNYHFFHSIGIYGILHPKKEEPKVVPTIPAAPKDTDGDGISDDNDRCPTVPGVAKYQGCPVPDTDKDGINDDEDQCPTVPGVARYKGCPIPDTDKDGINDEEDKCPTVPGVARYQGCPVPDTDGDGVNDEEDKCPTEKGPAENFGCPKLEDYKFDARKVQFVTGSAQLTKGAMTELDKGAEILKAHPTLNISIEGHTDNTGTPASNQKLSEKRAAAVKNYLTKKGIDANRMSTSGYGQTKPVADNKTSAGRAANRRVEFKTAK